MTIRRTLLLAFALASLAPTVLLAALVFASVSRSMHAQIERSLQVEAATVSLDIDKMLFERLQNARTWSRLDVMQEVQVGDVDKRLATFLREVKTGYGAVYADVQVTDVHGRVVASSDARAIGDVPAPAPGTDGARYAAVRLGDLQVLPGAARPVLPIRAPLQSQFGDAPLGELNLLFDWGQIDRILDQAGQEGRDVLLLDRDGRIIGASARLRARGLVAQAAPRDWSLSGRAGTRRGDGAPLGLPPLTLGYAQAGGFGGFAGFGWTTVVLQPSRDAFAPVRSVGVAVLVLLALTSLGAAVFAGVVAGRLARPIVALTELTREFARGRPLPDPPAASGEVGELADAFVGTIGALEKSRADLVRASKLAALGELSAVVAHEIRTPIGILRSSAQMLAREPGLSAEGRELAGFIQGEASRLNGLVTTLLDSTRVRAPALRPMPINDVLRAALGMLASAARAKGIVVAATLAEPTPSVLGDDEQLTQVFLNLLQNAVQILPSGGRVAVASALVGAEVVVTVEDDGPGIAPAQRAQVFEAFFSTREGGFGLGLAAVQQIVSAHGGRIAVDSGALGGARFTVTLPGHEDTP